MSDLSRFKVEREARQRAAASQRITPYGEVMNRYLTAFSYVDPYAPPARRAEPTAVTGTVIVGVDGAPTGHVAVEQAAIEAELRGHALRIVHVGASPHHPGMMQRLIGRVHAFAPDLPVTTLVTVGTSPVDRLLSEAGAADLIVVGHRHGVARGALGRSVADRVAARHPGPVLVVPDAFGPAGPDLASRPLIAAMDGGAGSTHAAEFAVTEARIRGCDVTLLHVISEAGGVPDARERRGGVDVRTRTVTGDLVAEVVDASAGASAVVLGREPGRSRLDSVSRSILHRSGCPVFFAG
jgi:nucleotide-binding universal stress UspA family protein